MDPCSVCGGEGKPVSGGMCICRGSGTMVAELEGMRGLLFEITKEKIEYANTISKIKGVIAMAEEWAETQAMPETSACMSALKDIRRMVNTHSEEGIELQEGIQ